MVVVGVVIGIMVLGTVICYACLVVASREEREMEKHENWKREQ